MWVCMLAEWAGWAESCSLLQTTEVLNLGDQFVEALYFLTDREKSEG